MIEIFFPTAWKAKEPKPISDWMLNHLEFNMGYLFFVRDTGQLIWMAKVV